MLHIRTPLILHPTLSTTSRRIWLKLENLQPSGSFKLRGMGLLCSQAAAQGKRKVVCPSGGNAGLATAVAAASLGLQACIVVPHTTPKRPARGFAAPAPKSSSTAKSGTKPTSVREKWPARQTPSTSRPSTTRCCGKGTAR